MKITGKSKGTAVVIALLVLLILSVLATAGMRMSVAELWMAGNERFRRSASDAASAGIEVTVARVSRSGASKSSEPVVEGPVRLSETSPDAYTVSLRYTGKEAAVPRSSAEKFEGDHFEIRSTGTSSRSARDVQVQGVMLITAPNGVKTFDRRGDGLESTEAP
jgi:type II secretory pathway component PulK